MASWTKVTELDDGVAVAEMPTYTNGNASAAVTVPGGSESDGETVAEVIGTGDYQSGMAVPQSEVESINEASEAENHRSVSSPPRGPAQPTTIKTEATAVDTESYYEELEGFDASALDSDTSESDQESAEPLIEAAFADPSGDPEFFAALLPALKPLVTSVLPMVVSAVARQGVQSLSPALQSLVGRLQRLGLRPSRVRREAGMEDGGEIEDAAVEAMLQQVEALEVIIGRDDRVRVSNTKRVPWNRICHLSIRAANGSSYLGTGFLVGRRTVITAGHCLFIHGAGGWAHSIEVTPGRNASDKPYGNVTATSFRSTYGWVYNKNRNYDYGAIILPRPFDPLGAFGFANLNDAGLLNKRLNSAGYPGDKPAGTMWFNANKCKAVTARTLVYDIDTMGGQSGSPVWIRRPDGARIVVGIHTNGALSGNSATRVTREVYSNLKRWRTEGGA